MNRKRGFMTPALCLIILLTTLAFLAVFYADVTAHNIRIKSREPILATTISRRTALERAESYFFHDYDYTGTIVYDDLDLQIDVTELLRDDSSRTVRLTVYEIKESVKDQWQSYHAVVWDQQSPALEIIAPE